MDINWLWSIRFTTWLSMTELHPPIQTLHCRSAGREICVRELCVHVTFLAVLTLLFRCFLVISVKWWAPFFLAKKVQEDFNIDAVVGRNKWQRDSAFQLGSCTKSFLHKEPDNMGLSRYLQVCPTSEQMNTNEVLTPQETFPFFPMNRVECCTSIILSPRLQLICLRFVEPCWTVPFWISGDSNFLPLWDWVLSRSRLGQKNEAASRPLRSQGVDVNHQLDPEKSPGPG